MKTINKVILSITLLASFVGAKAMDNFRISRQTEHVKTYLKNREIFIKNMTSLKTYIDMQKIFNKKQCNTEIDNAISQYHGENFKTFIMQYPGLSLYLYAALAESKYYIYLEKKQEAYKYVNNKMKEAARNRVARPRLHNTVPEKSQEDRDLERAIQLNLQEQQQSPLRNNRRTMLEKRKALQTKLRPLVNYVKTHINENESIFDSFTENLKKVVRNYNGETLQDILNAKENGVFKNSPIKTIYSLVQTNNRKQLELELLKAGIYMVSNTLGDRKINQNGKQFWQLFLEQVEELTKNYNNQPLSTVLEQYPNKYYAISIAYASGKNLTVSPDVWKGSDFVPGSLQNLPLIKKQQWVRRCIQDSMKKGQQKATNKININTTAQNNQPRLNNNTTTQSTQQEKTRECTICFDTKTLNNFSAMPCGHVLCKTCMSKTVPTRTRYERSATKKCPFCRKPF